MKSLNNFINEALIKKTSKINYEMTKQDIINYILSLTSYSNYTDKEINQFLYDEIKDIANRWIKDFNIKNIKEIWINAVSDIAYGKLRNLAKKEFPNIDLSIVKSIVDFSDETNILATISENGKTYDTYIFGNKLGLYIEYTWLQIGFITEKGLDVKEDLNELIKSI